jgi:small-conductance mechanosensitive channel
MFKSIDISASERRALLWFYDHFWTESALTQGVILIGIFVLAAALNKLIAARLTAAGAQWKPSRRVKYMLHNVGGLMLPVIALFLMFCAHLAEGAGFVPENSDLLHAAMKLTGAWIVIGCAAQIINNGFARRIVALVVWCIVALSLLGILDQTAAALDSLGMSFGKMHVSVLAVMKGVAALCVLLYVAAALSSLIERRILHVTGLTMSSRVLIAKITRVTLVTFALLIAVTSAGIDLSLLAVFSGALGLGVGFGLQKGLSNLFSGFMLLADKSIKPGDIIELSNGIYGWVHKMGGRYTEIITRDNKSFLIPNEEFITSRVVNWSHGDTLIRLEVKFTVGYDSDPHAVKRIAREAALAPERVVRDPSPVAHITEFASDGISFVVRFWIKDAEKGVTNIKGLVMLALWDAFKANNIELPFPRRDVYIKEHVKERAA